MYCVFCIFLILYHFQRHKIQLLPVCFVELLKDFPVILRLQHTYIHNPFLIFRKNFAPPIMYFKRAAMSNQDQTLRLCVSPYTYTTEKRAFCSGFFENFLQLFYVCFYSFIFSSINTHERTNRAFFSILRRILFTVIKKQTVQITPNHLFLPFYTIFIILLYLI